MPKNRNYPPGPNDHLLGMRTMSRFKADVLGTYDELQRIYGDAVSFRTGAYRTYFFFHPDHVREVLVTQARSFIRMPRVMKTFAQWNGNSLLIAEGRPWASQRRLVQQAFQPHRMQQYGRTMVAHARRLVDSWRGDMDESGHVDVDINQVMTALTLSIICETMFGGDCAEASCDIAKAVAILSEVAFYEMQSMLRLPMWIPTPRNRRKRWAMNLLDRVVWEFVRRRRSEQDDRGDLLSMLLAAVDDQQEGKRLDDRQARDESMTLMLAGHDTTASAFVWLWYNLARYPEVARRCREEVKLVVGDEDPAVGHLERLPYLEATIKETLRLFPPAIGVFLRQATADVTIDGYDVPKKSLVALSSYVTQRDERWFLKPERFQPERFLPPDSDNIPAGAFFPFGAGPRICIGQAFAMTEMMLVAAALLQTCQVSLVPGEPDPEPFVHMALRTKQPLLLRWQRR